MPRATKETSEKELKKSPKASTSKKKAVSSKEAKAKTSKVSKKSTSSTVSEKIVVAKAPATTKKTAEKKTVAKKQPATTKKTATKKVTSKKVDEKKETSKKSPTKNNTKKSINVLEYYDLPYRYNKTIVKILAQTPKTLFVYWDISDEDRQKYIKEYGEDFFEKTKPVLIIHNNTMNYTFEIEINDFANCWYFNINDEKCEYSIELGRKPKSNNTGIPNDYLYVTSSNKIESPNGHILFEKNQKTIFYRNVKTGETYSKDIINLDFIRHLGRIYNLNDLYKKIYSNEDLRLLNNPSSKFY